MTEGASVSTPVPLPINDWIRLSSSNNSSLLHQLEHTESVCDHWCNHPVSPTLESLETKCI